MSLRPGHVALQVGGKHAGDLPAGPVRRHADEADRADGHHRERQVVLAAVDLETGGHHGGQARRIGHVGDRVLHRHDVGDVVGEPGHGLVGDAAASADGDVVDHDRQVRRAGHGRHVEPDALLGRPVVVRGHDQQSVDAGVGGRLRHLHGVRCVVAADAGHDRDRHRLLHAAPQRALLRLAQGRPLACRPGDDQAFGAVVDQPTGQRCGRVEIEGALLVEGRDHGGDERPKPRAVGAVHRLRVPAGPSCLPDRRLAPARSLRPPRGPPGNRRRTRRRPRSSPRGARRRSRPSR